MALYEYVGNLHMHTPYSDGTEYHAAIAKAALSAGLDFIVVTDHNLYMEGVEGYYSDDAGQKHILVLIGEEVHDRTRLPQVNHLLVYNTCCEVTQYAQDPQKLIDVVVNQAKGLAFIAHPYDPQIPWMSPWSEGLGIPWVDWDVKGYTGLEICNYMSDWKLSLPTFRQGLQSVFRPEEAFLSPDPRTLAKWDELLATGQRVVGIGNADAHGTYFRWGLLKARVFPYDFLFRCVNTHVLTSTQLSGNVEFDRSLIYAALAQGRAYIGYDIPGDTRGFRFSGQSVDGMVTIGEDIRLKSGVTLQVKTPRRAHIKIIRHGEIVAENPDADAMVYHAMQPGAYRVEAWLRYKDKPRCWILSNPIYITE